MKTLFKNFLIVLLLFVTHLSLRATDDHTYFIREIIEEIDHRHVSELFSIIDMRIAQEKNHEHREDLRWLQKTFTLSQKLDYPISAAAFHSKNLLPTTWFTIKNQTGNFLNMIVRPCVWLTVPALYTLLMVLINEDLKTGKNSALINLFYRAQAYQWMNRNIPGSSYIPSDLKEGAAEAYSESQSPDTIQAWQNGERIASLIGIPSLFLIFGIRSLKSFLYHGKKIDEFRKEISHLKKHFQSPAAQRVMKIVESQA